MAVCKRPECEWKGKKPTWFYRFTVNKVRYYNGIYATQKEAKDAEEAKRRELNSKRYKTIPLVMATFSEFLPRFAEHRLLTKATKTCFVEKGKGRQLNAFFGPKRMTNITINDINTYVAQKKKRGLANRTINLELNMLRSIYKYAIECGVADNNPAKEVPNLREIKHEKWIPTKDEFKRFMECSEQIDTARYFVPWLWFRTYTGTRPTESVYMEWKDIDFDNDRICIRPKQGNELKNGKFRFVNMHPELKTILLAWREEWQAIQAKRMHRNIMDRNRKDREILPEHDWVFIHPTRHGRRADCFTRSFNKTRELAGLPKMTSHTLRHCFISNCVMSGIAFFTIAKWVGHSNSRMIEEVYGHLSPDYCKEQIGKLTVV